MSLRSVNGPVLEPSGQHPYSTRDFAMHTKGAQAKPGTLIVTAFHLRASGRCVGGGATSPRASPQSPLSAGAHLSKHADFPNLGASRRRPSPGRAEAPEPILPNLGAI